MDLISKRVRAANVDDSPEQRAIALGVVGVQLRGRFRKTPQYDDRIIAGHALDSAQ